MASVYRFLVTVDDHDSVERVIDIKPGNSLNAFKKCILKSLNFNEGISKSYFFQTDGIWHREDPIANNTKDDKALIKTKLLQLVEDPHQRLIYEFDDYSYWSLKIELQRIATADDKATYPLCFKSEGTAQQRPVAPLPTDDEEELEKEDELPLKASIIEEDLGIDESEFDEIRDNEPS